MPNSHDSQRGDGELHTSWWVGCLPGPGGLAQSGVANRDHTWGGSAWRSRPSALSGDERLCSCLSCTHSTCCGTGRWRSDTRTGTWRTELPGTGLGSGAGGTARAAWSKVAFKLGSSCSWTKVFYQMRVRGPKLKQWDERAISGPSGKQRGGGVPGGHQCPGRPCPCARKVPGKVPGKAVPRKAVSGNQSPKKRSGDGAVGQGTGLPRGWLRRCPMPGTCLQKREKQMQSLEALSQQEWPHASWAGKRGGQRGSRPLPS